MYINNLERNWKNFVRISVKSFANLYISKLQGRLHQKKKKAFQRLHTIFRLENLVSV